MDVVCIDALITGSTEHQIIDNLTEKQRKHLILALKDEKKRLKTRRNIPFVC